MNDDFDKDEWGNIELPGLSDEELYTKNWNKARTKAEKEHFSKTSKANMSNPKYRKHWDVAQKEGIEKRNAENKEWRHNVAEANRKKYQDPEYKKALLKGIANRSDEWRENVSRARSEINADPKVKAAHRKRMKKLHKDPEYKAALAKGIANRSDEWRQNVIAAQQARAMPLITPYGEFDGVNDAKRKGLVSIEGCMVRMPHLFYYKEKGPGEPTYEMVVVSDFGEFRSIKDCFNKHKEMNDPTASSLWKFKKDGDYKKVKMPCREWINRLEGDDK